MFCFVYFFLFCFLAVQTLATARLSAQSQSYRIVSYRIEGPSLTAQPTSLNRKPQSNVTPPIVPLVSSSGKHNVSARLSVRQSVGLSHPLRPEDGTVPVIILFAIVFSCVTDCNFNIVRCPCNGLCLVKCHLNLHIDITLHYILNLYKARGAYST